MSKDHANMSPANYAEGNGMYASIFIGWTDNVDDTNEIQLYVILTSSLGNYELAKMIRQMWLQRPSPKGLKPLMSAAPDWQPDLRNVKQYGITISKPKFITLDNRTSAIFNEAAVSASLPHFFAK